MSSPLSRLRPSANYRQTLVALLGLLLGLGIFIGLQRLITPRYIWVTPLDEWIPFVAQSWWLYVLFFPFVLLAATYASADAFRAFKGATGMAFAIAVLCFWLFPEHLPRPELGSLDNSFVHQRLSRMWQLDRASNGCPSLHVAVTCLACRALWSHPGKGWIGLTGLLICLSTLTLKQHTLLDVAGGVLLALACSLASQSQGSHSRAPA